MLSIVWLSELACKKSLWSEFDPARQIWVVSDAKSKVFLTRSLLETREIVQGEPVKKARELWAQMLRDVDPSYRVLGALGEWVAAREFLNRRGRSSWCIRPRAPQTLLDSAKNLVSLATHPLADEFLSDLERQFKLGSDLFIELTKMCVEFYQEALQSKRLPRFFVPAFLAQNPQRLPKGNTFIFDLGFELMNGEKELIQELSKNNGVKVLIPAQGKHELQDKGLAVYALLDSGLSEVKEQTLPPRERKPALEIWRCSSPDAEARKAVEKISQWIKNGIKPERIGVAAADISAYQGLLEHDLKWEGLGLQSDFYSRLSACRLFRALNARLSVMKGHWEYADLEEAFLTVSAHRRARQRQKERQILKPAVEEEQIPVDDIRRKIKEMTKIKPRGVLTRGDFEKLLISLYDDLVSFGFEDAELSETESRDGFFLQALKNLRTEVGEAKLDFEVWVEAWQKSTSEVKVTYRNPASGGVWAVDLDSAEEAPVDKIIVLGAVNLPVKRSVVSNLPEALVNYLKQLGFDFSTTSVSKNDSLVSWLTRGPWTETVVSCAKTDFSGKTNESSPLWLNLATSCKKNLEILDGAEDLLWLKVQRHILSSKICEKVDVFKGWTGGWAHGVGQRVAEELEQTKAIHIPLLVNPLPVTLSASNIESHWDCPFKFFVTQFVGLRDDKDLDVEPTPQTRGQLLHQAAEKILSAGEPMESWTEERLGALVDQLGSLQRRVTSDVWPSSRNRFVRQLKRFTEFEAQWQRRYPRSHPAAFEVAITGFVQWNAENPSITFSTQKPGSNFFAPFRGRIDRLDLTAQSQAILLDYKDRVSSAQTGHIRSWNKKGSFQLALYTQAVEAGLSSQGPRPVIAAQYYSLRNLEREKGFQLVDEDLTGILPAEKKTAGWVDREGRGKYFDEIMKSVHERLEMIRNGEMTPHPQDENLCQPCSWRKLCRAHHLS